ncbi:MAG: hypothetical protein VX225_00555 [Pseudomonadota bacterium]|nr:hypothetical protein [Pseudomonadota bacterium]
MNQKIIRNIGWSWAAAQSVFFVQVTFSQVPDLTGVWWQGAPVPPLSDTTQSPFVSGIDIGPGGGGGMGISAEPLLLTSFGQERMANFDPIDDPAVRCEQPGLVRQILSPYPIRIEQDEGQVVIVYEEWAITRRLLLNGENVSVATPLTPMGYPLAYIEDSKLVVETSQLSEGLNMSRQFFWTSESASTIEHYYLNTRSQLVMDLIVTDPVMLSRPWVVQKIWNPYDGQLLGFECILRERP